MIRRREFIGGLVSAAALTSRAAWAQNMPKRASLGYLSGSFETEARPFIGIFLEGLRRQGYVEGRDFDIAYRFAEGQYDQLRPLAQQLVDLNPDAIITPTGDVAALAIRAVTEQIPIVSPTLTNPVRSGLIASFNRPGGNVTGISTLVEQLPQKQLELAVEALPGKARFGVLVNLGAGEPAIEQQRQIEAASATLRVSAIPIAVRAPDDLEAAFQALAEVRAQAVIVLQDGMLVTQRRRIVALASNERLPDIHSVRDAVIAGGFLCYGVNLRENFLRSAALVAKILRGEVAANLPVEFPTKLDLVVNAKTAKALGLDIPPTLLARADEVIE
jgi:ABC-type uncharacterized transport system substrate-binding protein